jgi:hypothetical protein
MALTRVRAALIGIGLVALLVGGIAAASTSPSEKKAQLHERAAPGTCGLAPTTDPDCSRHDMGSCGNACCGVEVEFAATASRLTELISRELARHGSDGSFKPAQTWGSFFALDGGGCRDLRSSTETANQLLCQATHTTSGQYRFEDTVNIKMLPSVDQARTSVRFFSISNIAGALGDAGQNFKNIMLIVRGIEAEGASALRIRTWVGCRSKGEDAAKA